MSKPTGRVVAVVPDRGDGDCHWIYLDNGSYYQFNVRKAVVQFRGELPTDPTEALKQHEQRAAEDAAVQRQELGSHGGVTQTDWDRDPLNQAFQNEIDRH